MRRGRRWLGNVRTALGFAFEASTKLAFATLVIIPLSLAGQFAVAVSLKLVIDGSISGSRSEAITGAIVGAAALSTPVVWLPLGASLSVQLQMRIGMIVDRRIMSLLAAVPGLEVHERPDYLSQLQLLLRDRFSLSAVVQVVASTVVFVALTVGVAIVLALQTPVLALLPLLALPSLWFGARAERLWRAADDATADEWRLSQAMLDLATNAAAGKEVRLLGLAGHLLGRHDEAREVVHLAKARAAWRGALLTAAGWALFVVAYVGAVLVVVRRSVAGQASPGDVIFTIALAAPILSVAGQAAGYLRHLTQMATAAGRYRWLAELSYLAARPPAYPAAMPDAATDGITLSAVGFAYAGSDDPALSEVSLHLPAGKVVALIGDNGAGKSTLVKLLCRLYEPTTGTVTLDGVDVRRFDVAEWRDRISAGFQDFCRFEVLVREAVGVGDIARVGDDDAIHAGLTRAGATGMTDGLPAGLDTQLGTIWEGGVDLSGGEWQKLALGRALMADRPLLLVLDEPTASLDPDTEHALFERFAASARSGASRGQITVLVSHRFSTVRMADLIVVLNGGHVVESGSHHDLMARDGLYAELYELGTRAYR